MSGVRPKSSHGRQGILRNYADDAEDKKWDIAVPSLPPSNAERGKRRKNVFLPIPGVKKQAAHGKPNPRGLALARQQQQEPLSARERGRRIPSGRYAESKKSDSSPSFIRKMSSVLQSTGRRVADRVDSLWTASSPVPSPAKASTPAKTSPKVEDLVDLCDDDSGDDHNGSESQEGSKRQRSKLRHKHKEFRHKADGPSHSLALPADLDPGLALEIKFRSKFHQEPESSQPTDDHTARNLFHRQKAIDDYSSGDEKVPTKPTTKVTTYQERLYGSIYQHEKDSPPPDPTPQQAPIEKTEFTLNHKANGNNPEEKKTKSCRDFQQRKKDSMKQQKSNERNGLKRRQEEAAANPICLDDDDDEVKEAPTNMDDVRVPRKHNTCVGEGDRVVLRGPQNVFDSHMSLLGKRQSFPQSPADTNSLHTQPDSSEEKSKRLHIEEGDDEDELSYSQLRSSQASEYSQTSELRHPGQHLDHEEIPSFGYQLGVSDLVPKTHDSPSLDTGKFHTALTSIEKNEPGGWNLTDELERSETKKPFLSLQKVNGAKNKKTKRKRSVTKIVPGASFSESQSDRDRKSPSRRMDQNEGTKAMKHSHGLEPSEFYSKSKKSQSPFPPLKIAAVTPRRSGRHHSGKHSMEILELSDSEDEEESHEVHKYVCDILRIAIGSRVYFSGCKISFCQSSGALELQYEKATRMQRNKGDRNKKEPQIEVQCVSLTDNALEELKYFAVGEETEDSAGEEPSSSSCDPENNPDVFVAMRVTPDEKNGLQKFSNSYSQMKCPEHKYLVLEFREDKDMKKLLEEMRACPPVSPYTGSSSSLKAIDVPKYAKALMNDTKKEKSSRMSVTPSAKRNEFIGDMKYDDILLVYPFAGEKKNIEKASKGFYEAKANPMLEQESELNKTSTTEEPSHSVSPVPGSGEDSSDTRQAIKTRNRAHYLTVRVEDYERLDPGEWLNDTLIDFWMQWLQRAVVDRHASDLHIFSSHFFTTLSDDGTDAVRSWTAKKNIDIFQKKLIFIPINRSLHWSLCVVVNPGAIVNASSDEGSADDPLACMIFLDSLKAHKKVWVRTQVMKWLNAEWSRLKKEEDRTHNGNRFTKKTFPILDPVVPYQDNGWDCGVFVCRYAFSMYQLRHRKFTYAEAGVGRADRKADKRPFEGLITDSPEFGFDMEDIARIRQDIRTLIERLSKMYSYWKKKKDLAEKEARLEEKARLSQARKSDANLSKDSSESVAANEQKENFKNSVVQDVEERENSSSAGFSPSTGRADNSDNIAQRGDSSALVSNVLETYGTEIDSMAFDIQSSCDALASHVIEEVSRFASTAGAADKLDEDEQQDCDESPETGLRVAHI